MDTNVGNAAYQATLQKNAAGESGAAGAAHGTLQALGNVYATYMSHQAMQSYQAAQLQSQLYQHQAQFQEKQLEFQTNKEIQLGLNQDNHRFELLKDQYNKSFEWQKTLLEDKRTREMDTMREQGLMQRANVEQNNKLLVEQMQQQGQNQRAAGDNYQKFIQNQMENGVGMRAAISNGLSLYGPLLGPMAQQIQQTLGQGQPMGIHTQVLGLDGAVMDRQLPAAIAQYNQAHGTNIQEDDVLPSVRAGLVEKQAKAVEAQQAAGMVPGVPGTAERDWIKTLSEIDKNNAGNAANIQMLQGQLKTMPDDDPSKYPVNPQGTVMGPKYAMQHYIDGYTMDLYHTNYLKQSIIAHQFANGQNSDVVQQFHQTVPVDPNAKQAWYRASQEMEAGSPFGSATGPLEWTASMHPIGFVMDLLGNTAIKLERWFGQRDPQDDAIRQLAMQKRLPDGMTVDQATAMSSNQKHDLLTQIGNVPVTMSSGEGVSTQRPTGSAQATLTPGTQMNAVDVANQARSMSQGQLAAILVGTAGEAAMYHIASKIGPKVMGVLGQLPVFKQIGGFAESQLGKVMSGPLGQNITPTALAGAEDMIAKSPFGHLFFTMQPIPTAPSVPDAVANGMGSSIPPEFKQLGVGQYGPDKPPIESGSGDIGPTSDTRIPGMPPPVAADPLQLGPGMIGPRPLFVAGPGGVGFSDIKDTLPQIPGIPQQGTGPTDIPSVPEAPVGSFDPNNLPKPPLPQNGMSPEMPQSQSNIMSPAMQWQNQPMPPEDMARHMPVYPGVPNYESLPTHAVARAAAGDVPGPEPGPIGPTDVTQNHLIGTAAFGNPGENIPPRLTPQQMEVIYSKLMADGEVEQAKVWGDAIKMRQMNEAGLTNQVSQTVTPGISTPQSEAPTGMMGASQIPQMPLFPRIQNPMGIPISQNGGALFPQLTRPVAMPPQTPMMPQVSTIQNIPQIPGFVQPGPPAMNSQIPSMMSRLGMMPQMQGTPAGMRPMDFHPAMTPMGMGNPGMGMQARLPLALPEPYKNMAQAPPIPGPAAVTPSMSSAQVTTPPKVPSVMANDPRYKEFMAAQQAEQVPDLMDYLRETNPDAADRLQSIRNKVQQAAQPAPSGSTQSGQSVFRMNVGQEHPATQEILKSMGIDNSTAFPTRSALSEIQNTARSAAKTQNKAVQIGGPGTRNYIKTNETQPIQFYRGTNKQSSVGPAGNLASNMEPALHNTLSQLVKDPDQLMQMKNEIGKLNPEQQAMILKTLQANISVG